MAFEQRGRTQHLSVVACAVVLTVTTLAKGYGLFTGGPLLQQPHPFLYGSYGFYVWAGFLAEILALATLLLAKRLFLPICLGLSILFVGYHAMESALHIAVSCPCLGGILGVGGGMAAYESFLSFIMACGLGVMSFVALGGPCESDDERSGLGVTPLARERILGGPVISAILWLGIGLLVIGLWRGKELAGDEGMEAAKALQYLRNPTAAAAMWNDQPAAWSKLLSLVFGSFGPSLSSARITSVLIGLLLPITWAVYAARMGVPAAGPAFVLIAWPTQGAFFASFLLDVLHTHWGSAPFCR